jgi:general secretion pathway protein J
MSASGRPASTARDRRRGFTLMELLVAMTLLGILMAALFGGLRLGARVWEASDRTLDQSSEAEVIRGFLRTRFEQVLPVTGALDGPSDEALFRGDRTSLRFVSAMPVSFGFQPYLLELRLMARQSAASGSDLMLRWRALDGTPATGEAHGGERVLIADVAEIAFGYFAGRQQQRAGAWVEDWRDQEDLPSLIRLELRFPEGDRRRFSPLIVSPMIDEWYDTAF